MKPPVAARRDHERSRHGDVVNDPYAWLIDREDDEVLAYLKDENAFTEATTAGLADLRETVFQEIKARTKETDLSVPTRKGDWWYYSRSVEGLQYSISCRVAADGPTPPALPQDGSALPGEHVLLDGNALAEGHEFFALGTFEVSPDGKLLAYALDVVGDERFTLKVRDLATGEDLADEVANTYYSTAWSRDGSTLFYTTINDAWRPYRVHRHALGTPTEQDEVVFQEDDDRFFVDVSLLRSERFIEITCSSQVTSEVRLLDSDDPTGTFQIAAPRRDGVEYSVDHWSHPGDPSRDLLLVLHNADGKTDFELATAPVSALGDHTAWTPLVPHRQGTRLDAVDVFAGHLVVGYRRDGLTGLAVHGIDADSGTPAAHGEPIEFPERIRTVSGSQNPDYDSTRYRLGYTSMVTPSSVYDYDVTTGELTLLKQQPVLGGYDPADYEQERVWATAQDGARVPVTLVHKKGVVADGSNPCVLYGYGAYEISIDPSFSIARLSLLDRGFVFAIAHIRGGGEMGRHWYEDGKFLNKRNTFTDFVACARQLVADHWTAPDRLAARGASAGGLLMGAVANIAPDDFRAIVAGVPFVDALNTILDPDLPLTVMEWEEWGNPVEDPEIYGYMKGYSPYENVANVQYPAILALTSLNDTRVGFHEPAKWIARLRAEAGGEQDFLLKTEMDAGHGGRSGRYTAWQEEAFTLAWVIDKVSAVE
ncbi:S9 family peptidase [Catenulispora sp. NL8]|uniref:S9 family peptidase n=1 Tax=Catenulispora pinistramenti TaxID=2705254 RepID=A0ABS5KUA3_9ACTN|nr:S9 family peptidase [Catenulispora pinistramenti]MBS2549584.1 S9 family peptidase [Catenulispora pinistramenti]